MTFFAESRLIHRSYSGGRPSVRSIQSGTAGNKLAGDDSAAVAQARRETEAVAARAAAAKKAEQDAADATNTANTASGNIRVAEQEGRAATIAAGGPKTSVSTSDYQAPAPASTLTRAQKAEQSQAEATLQAQYLSDPSFQSSFQLINDYLLQLKTASPAEQQQIHNDMSSIANSLVDTPFNHRVQVQKDGLTRKIRQLNETYNELSTSETLKLETAIQNLDLDAVKNLDANFDDIFSRAGTSSGLLRRVADQIIETHDVGEAQKRKATEQSLKTAKVAAQQDQENEEAVRKEEIYNIEQERTAARSTQLSDLVNEAEQGSLLRAEASGVGSIQTPSSTIGSIRTATTPQQKATAAGARGLSTAAPVVATPDKPSVAAIRTNTPTPNSTPAAPARVQPVVNPNTGTAYTGGAADRLAARLSR